MGSVYRAYDRLTNQYVALKLVPIGEYGDRPTRGDGDSLRRAEAVDPSLTAFTVGSERTSGPAAAGSAFSETVAGELLETDLERVSRVHIGVASPNSPTNPLWARLALAQEFRTLASLRHPHIISVLDYGFVARSHPFFTMELLQNARNLSTASKRLPLTQKVLLLIQLLHALSYLHRHGILHRDLKPANVMVIEGSEGLSVKLLDFGLALARANVQNKPGEISGTLSYMAPELLEGHPASAAVDLFAVGIIAYELFTDQHPFDRGNDIQLIEAILGRDPEWDYLAQHPALTSLLSRLLAKSAAARPSADEAIHALSAAVGIPVPKESSALRESALQAARFVGREEPLALLRAATDAARAGAGGVRLLAGESGVGKSRLMEELRVYCLVQGMISTRGQAVREGGGAYGVWIDILRTLCLCVELDAVSASVLKSLVPDLDVLLDWQIPDAPIIDPKAAQLRLINVVESLLVRQTEPLLLLIEDLHWTDADSLMLLRRLAPLCTSRPILIIGSFRDDESPNLPQELTGWPILKLGRLPVSSIADLCQATLGDHGYTQEFVEFLESETEGNVFFVIEVMRALAEEAGQLSLVASKRLPRHVLTGGIQAIVQRRLARLPEEARPLLRLAAVAGRQLDLAVLRRFEPSLEPWLYLCADAAVLEVSGQSWRFAHDKIRESLLSKIESEERQSLHLALACALEATHPGAVAHTAALAEHYQRGGSAAKAAFYFVEAGVYALSQGATGQAAGLLTQALLPEGRGLLSKLQAARARNALIQATLALGRIAPCLAIYEEFMAEVGFTIAAGWLSVPAIGSAMLAQLWRANTIRSSTEEERRIRAEIAQASRWAFEACVLDSQLGKSIAAALCGATVSRSIGDRERQSYFWAVFSYVAGLVPMEAASRSFLKIGARLIEGTKDPRAELDFRRVAGGRHLNAANADLAKSQFDSVIALSRQIGDEYALMSGLACRVVIAFREEDEAAFETLGPELHARSRRNQSDYFARIYPLTKGIKAMRRGDNEGAHCLLLEAEGYTKKSQDLVGQAFLGGFMACCLLLQGKKEEALVRADETLTLVESTRATLDSVGWGLAAVTEVYLELWEAGTTADRQKLQDPLHRALAALRRYAVIFPYVAPRALLWHGRYAWNRGGVRLSRRLGEASLRRARRIGIPFDEALARKWLACFALAPPGAVAGPSSEVRALLELFVRRLG